MKKSFFVDSLGELESLAKWIAPFLRRGLFLCISGDLGVGKTTLVQFLCSELATREKVTSPTFTILKSYWSEQRNCFVNHFDFFRITSENDVEVFSDIGDESINIVEWPEKAPSFFSKRELIEVKISFHQTSRKVEILHDLLKLP